MSRRTSAAVARRAPARPEPARGLTVAIEIRVRRIAFCTCGCTTVAHHRPKGRGRCLIHHDCAAFQEATDADA